jgi:hypothetical protein
MAAIEYLARHYAKYLLVICQLLDKLSAKMYLEIVNMDFKSNLNLV